MERLCPCESMNVEQKLLKYKSITLKKSYLWEAGLKHYF